MDLFAFFYMLTSSYAKTSRTMLNRYGEWTACLVPDFSGIALSFSPFNLMLAVILLYIALIIFTYVPQILDLSKKFYHEEV